MPTKENADQQKAIGYYNALVNAWIQTRMERDKSLLALSGAGIGLCTSLLTAFGVSSWWHLVAYFIALGLFLTTILTCLRIFQKNSCYIEQVIKDETYRDKSLEVLDRVAGVCFALAFFALMAVGIIAAIINLQR